MSDRKYSDREVAYARRMNRMIESEWQHNLDQGKPPATQSEAAWRQEQRDAR